MTAPALSLPRKLLYAAIVSVVALGLLLGGLELGLRAGGYGHSPHLFRKAKAASGETLWRENRWVTAPYFPASLVRRPQPVRLPEKKAASTYRIFILGSSAAMGDPEPAFSLARVLEVLLHDAYPAQRFEVVNAAVTAINSHVVRGLAEDCADLEPDLFIVYEGNNEVIGPFGPAGVLAPFLRSEGAIRTTAWLKGTRTGQLLASLGQKNASANWGGMEMFLQQQVTAEDARLQAVRAHFGANLRAIAGSARRAGATTLLCTVATNQRDFAPFLSQHGEAERAYQEARTLLAAGRDDEARLLFRRALDLDTLRFRTDSTLNEVIRGLDGTPGVQLVDAAALLDAQSPHGICGDEFFYEHVHLNLRGTYTLAQNLLPAITADLAKHGVTAAPQPLTDYSALSVRLGYSAYEQSMIALEMVHRLGRPPFTGQSDHAGRVARWQRAVDQGVALLARPDATDALREIGRRALAQSPDDWILARNTGAMLVSRQQPAEALPLLERAAAWIDDDPDTLVALGWAHRALGHAAEAEAAFGRARTLEPDYPNLPPAGAK